MTHHNAWPDTIVSINPADGSTAGQVPHATPVDVETALSRSRHAHDQGEWRRMPPHERAAVMRKIADLITMDTDRLAGLQVRENGKPLSECRTIVEKAAAAWIYYASVLETAETEVTPHRGPYLSHTIQEPYGVILAITPWNSPLMIESYKIAPALAAGNCVILKPSEETPQTSLELYNFAEKAGLPHGTLTVVQGRGGLVGPSLVNDPRVNLITFTGGTTTGQSIAAAAAERLVPCILELGGKSPQIVFDDADFDRAVDGVVGGICGAAGQSCTAGSRLLVQAAIYERFITAVRDKMSARVVGDPLCDKTEMGPLVSFAHRDKVAAYVDIARTEGATVETGGVIPGKDLIKGAYYRPTLLTGLDVDSRLWNEEVFGPVLCARPFDGLESLVRDANCGDYGLAAGIWTRDFAKAWETGRKIDAGTIWINTYDQSSISTPFGGFGKSGIGREKGAQCLAQYSQLKSFYWGLPESTALSA